MENKFSVKKLPLEVLIDLLMDLYESGVDFVDLSGDNSDPIQDKLIIETKEDYFNEDVRREMNEGKKPKKKKKPTLELPSAKKLSEDDINELL